MSRACLNSTECFHGIGELERNLYDGRLHREPDEVQLGYGTGRPAATVMFGVAWPGQGEQYTDIQKKADGSDCLGNLKNGYLFRDVWGVRARNKVSNVGFYTSRHILICSSRNSMSDSKPLPEGRELPAQKGPHDQN